MKIKKIIIAAGIVFTSVFLLYVVFYEDEVLFNVDSFSRKNYTEEELLLFCDIAFNRYGRLRKWETNIKVEIMNIDGLTECQIADVDSCIAIIAPLLHPLKMERVLSDGNFLIYTCVDKLPVGNGSGLGYAKTNNDSFFKSRITYAEIYEIKYQYGKDILLHEFQHGIGLSHPKKTYPYWMNISGTEVPYVFKSREEMDSFLDHRFPISSQEKKIIQMLYSTDFKCGLRRKTFMKKIGIKYDE